MDELIEEAATATAARAWACRCSPYTATLQRLARDEAEQRHLDPGALQRVTDRANYLLQERRVEALVRIRGS